MRPWICHARVMCGCSGHAMADRAIQLATNSPVNHVGMSVAIEDLPPLMWHAELGRSMTDVSTGTRQRGVQLHDLREAVIVWAARYGQRAWLRQLDPVVTGEMEDAVLRTIARLDGTPFPSTARLASGGWPAAAGPQAPGPRRRSGDGLLRAAAGRDLSGHGAAAGQPPPGPV